MPEARDDPGRQETEEKRADRNLTDLLQELRVAGLGVQVLFGFLLSLPFTAHFSDLDGQRRVLYVASLLMSALSIALLSAPVAYHRLVFRQHQKDRLLRAANVLALLGLGTVGCAISTAVLLVVSIVDHGTVVPVIGGLTVATFAGLWFVLPLARRRSANAEEAAQASE
jgi:MFS family permease